MGKVYKGLLIGQAGFQRPIVIKQLRDARTRRTCSCSWRRRGATRVLDHENIGRIFDFERRRRRAVHHPRVHRRLEPGRVPGAPPRARPPARRRAVGVHRQPGLPRAAVRVRAGGHRPPRRQPQQHHDDARGHGEADRLRHRHPQRHRETAASPASPPTWRRRWWWSCARTTAATSSAWAPCSSRC